MMQPGLDDKDEEMFVLNMTANVKYRPLIVQVGHNAKVGYCTDCIQPKTHLLKSRNL